MLACLLKFSTPLFSFFFIPLLPLMPSYVLCIVQVMCDLWRPMSNTWRNEMYYWLYCHTKWAKNARHLLKFQFIDLRKGHIAPPPLTLVWLKFMCVSYFPCEFNYKGPHVHVYYCEETVLRNFSEWTKEMFLNSYGNWTLW